MRKLKNILVTGGAGFIGCNFIHYLFNSSNSGTVLFDDADFNGIIVNLDSLTYSGNLLSLKDIEEKFGGKRYFFENADICDKQKIEQIFEKYNIDTVVNFAAETHVDRSIKNPEIFYKTNVMGTLNLLETARKFWNCSLDNIRNDVIFHQISTDEVYGSLNNDNDFFEETTSYNPRSPYSASKAACDHLVMSYYSTYGMPVTISNCSNNYGPFQFPEKLIPLVILNILEGKKIPVYGDGKNIRDWIYVEDHNSGVWNILKKSPNGEKWNIGGESEINNIDLIKMIIKIISEELGLNSKSIEDSIEFIKDRPGHDKRYAINCSKIKTKLNWTRKLSFEEGLALTVRWYLKNSQWIKSIKSKDYDLWIKTIYNNI